MGTLPSAYSGSHRRLARRSSALAAGRLPSLPSTEVVCGVVAERESPFARLCAMYPRPPARPAGSTSRRRHAPDPHLMCAGMWRRGPRPASGDSYPPRLVFLRRVGRSHGESVMERPGWFGVLDRTWEGGFDSRVSRRPSRRRQSSTPPIHQRLGCTVARRGLMKVVGHFSHGLATHVPPGPSALPGVALRIASMNAARAAGPGLERTPSAPLECLRRLGRHRRVGWDRHEGLSPETPSRMRIDRAPRQRPRSAGDPYEVHALVDKHRRAF